MKINWKRRFWEIIILLFFILLFVSCDELKENEKRMEKEKIEEIRVEKLPERMEMIFLHINMNNKDYYGLRDKQTGREYLVVLAGSSSGGVAVIELKPREE